MDIYHNIFDQLAELIVVLDRDFHILGFNREADRIHRSLAERPFETGRRFLDYVPQQRKKIVENILRQVVEEKKTVKTFAEYVTHVGPTVYLDLNYIPVPDTAGETEYIQIVGTDATPEKTFEKKMTALVTEVTDLFEHANALIIETDSRGYITKWNRHCSDLLGYDKDEIFTRKFGLLLGEADREQSMSFIQSVLEGENVHHAEIPLVKKNGEKLIVMFSVTPRRNATKKVTGITFVGQDITELTAYRMSLERKVEARTTELREALRKQEEALEVKSKFVSIASHEFRTPLTSLQHTARLLAQRHHTMTAEELAEKFAYIDYHTTNMLNLLGDVLVYGKSEPGKIRIIAQQLSPVDFFGQLIREVSESTKNSHVIHLTTKDLPPEISSDENLLRNIFVNLLTNAVKFSPASKDVYLEAEANVSQMVVRVRDHGIGMPNAGKQLVFEPFHRGSNVGNIPGTGLGMSIVKKAVDLLGGAITVESELNRGTTITISLPLNDQKI